MGSNSTFIVKSRPLTWGPAAGSSGSRWCSCRTGSASVAASEPRRWSLCWPGPGGPGSSKRTWCGGVTLRSKVIIMIHVTKNTRFSERLLSSQVVFTDLLWSRSSVPTATLLVDTLRIQRSRMDGLRGGGAGKTRPVQTSIAWRQFQFGVFTLNYKNN